MAADLHQLLVHERGEAWRRGHNDAVQAAMAGGAASRLAPSEAGILALVAGLQTLVEQWADRADAYSGGCLHELLRGFHGLLNYDLGRLDPGTLDAWAGRLGERWGIDPNTGEWKGGA